MSQIVNAEVNNGDRNTVLASNYATRIRGRHKRGTKCDLKGSKTLFALRLVGPGIEM